MMMTKEDVLREAHEKGVKFIRLYTCIKSKRGCNEPCFPV